jgi:UDP-N-acetylglucosamine 3-dehydrogenase
MSYLYGKKITSIYSVFGKVAHAHEDYAIITLRFGDESSGVIETNWLTPHKMRTLSVVGSLGIAELDYQNATLKIYDEKWIKEVKIIKEEPLKREIEHFVNCVRNGINPSVGLEEGKHALEVALMAIESAKTGKVCDIAKESLATSGR